MNECHCISHPGSPPNMPNAEWVSDGAGMYPVTGPVPVDPTTLGGGGGAAAAADAVGGPPGG